MDPTDPPTVLQTGPEDFDVWAGGGRLRARVSHRTRRGLGLRQIPPVAVATELVRFLRERDALPAAEEAPQPLDLGAAAGRFPEMAEEMRARLG